MDVYKARWRHGSGNGENYPLVMSNVAIENGPVEIVDLPSYKMVDLSIVMLVYQRVTWMDLTKNRGTPTGNHRNMVISPSQSW